LMEETSAASPHSRKALPPSSPSIAQSSNTKLIPAASSPVYSVEPRRSSSEVVRRSGSFKGSSKENGSRRIAEQASSPRTSTSSTSTMMTMSGTSSARDSLSSISTAMSSSHGDITPVGKVASSSASSHPPASALDDLARSTKPWIPLPNGLNKTWENLQKTPTFEKHSKRASILVSDVSDMSSSILGSLSTALLSSGGASSAPTMAMAGRRRSPAPTAPSNQRLSSASLLDDDDDMLMGGGGTLSAPIKPWSSPASTSSPILKPSAPPALSPSKPGSNKQLKNADTDDEDWNW